jgi:hypothetical protein
VDAGRVVLARFGGSEALARTFAVAPGVRLLRALDTDEGAVYAAAGVAEHTLRTTLGTSAKYVSLERTLRLDGAAAGREARFHYVVATNVLAAAEADFNAWYDEEHLAGLAAVPGTIAAARFINADPAAGPRYFACYDLATQEAFGSPAWLAVRATAWSTRVRPSFRNTGRTMYRCVSGG